VNNILVTGVGRGLGLAIAQRLCETAYRVIGVSRTLTKDYEALMGRHGAQRVHFHRYDLNDLDGIPHLVRSITAQVGPLYGLVNNAALGRDGVLATMHPTDIATVLRVNLEAPIVLAKCACRSMLTQKQGRIINITSIIATTGFSGLSIYGASKAGLAGFTRSLARELGKASITVNCVAPGFMATEMTATLSADKLDSIRRRAPLGLTEPVDVAGAVTYLLSTDACHITGTTVTVDGGSTA